MIEDNESTSYHTPTQSNASFRKKILYNFSKKSRHLRKSNSDRLERYLRDCVNDINIQSCSLFKEFLQPQREEDNIILKQVVQSYVEQQQNLSIVSKSRDIVNCGPSPPPDEAIIADERSFMSYSSFSSRIQPVTPQPIPSSSSSSSSSASSEQKDDMISLSSEEPVTIQDFQLIKVIGRGCMGKVSLHVCSIVEHKNLSSKIGTFGPTSKLFKAIGIKGH